MVSLIKVFNVALLADVAVLSGRVFNVVNSPLADWINSIL